MLGRHEHDGEVLSGVELFEEMQKGRILILIPHQPVNSFQRIWEL